MSLRVGVPKETKPLEGRVGLTPAAAGELVRRGVEVAIQQGAGVASGYTDADYRALGVQLQPDADALYDWARLVVKVKEPVGAEIDRLKPDHLLFCYLHLAANPELTRRLCEIGLTAVAFETVVDHGRLPILMPMSEIAGRIAVQVGAHLLHTPQGGSGILLGGLASVERGSVVVLGAGNAGSAAVRAAAALGANVTVFDKNPLQLERMYRLAPNVTALVPTAAGLAEAVAAADLLVGAVLLPGAAAPHLVSRAEVARMRPGSVVADIAVDQGGCIETTRPTTYDAPTYVEEGVQHFCVTNMPGAVPRSATQALTAALLPYLLVLLDPDWRDDARLAGAINVSGGQVVHPALL
ncbi:MAG: alanine dehydrogenase [Chromatiaceae bacterium]|jgi:alanine dehydrogenase|nr:alanine dehydrogenase [Chromatiaceae bacterium]